MPTDDPIWNEFLPLWTALPFAANQVQLAGGYGLFLKQKWLLVPTELTRSLFPWKHGRHNHAAGHDTI